MSIPPGARSPPRHYQNQGINGEGMNYSNTHSKTQLTSDDVENPDNGFATHNGHDYDALLSGTTIAPAPHNTTHDVDVSEINSNNNINGNSSNGKASSTAAATTPSSMTANSAHQRLQTNTNYMGAASGSGSSSGETTTSSVSPSAPVTPAVIPLTMTIGGSSGVSEVKLKRFLEHNQRLREQLEMRRVPVSEASQSLIQYVTSTQDGLLPSLWGTTGTDPFAKPSSGCCTIV
ncbi:unnamed protein product [Mortierella alpina]